LCDQLVDRLQESVRPRPIPVTRLTGDTETVLGAGLAELQPHPGTPHTVLVAGAVLDYSKPEWEEVTVMLTSSHLLLTHHFYQWQLGGRTSQQLAVKLAERIETIDSVDIYESWPGRCCLVLGGSRLGLRFATEAGVQELVAGFRQTWQHSRAGKQIEEVTSFHLAGREAVTMQSLLMDQSLSLAAFDLAQWIKITSQGKVKKKLVL